MGGRGGRVVEIRDPVAGRLVVHASEYEAARRLGADRLAALLARRPWLPSGERPLETAAALAVIHAPDDVGNPRLHLAAGDHADLPPSGPTPPAWDGP
jgi:hypothetical protein